MKDLHLLSYDISKISTDIDSHRNICDFQFFLKRYSVKSDRCSMANSLELRSPFLSFSLFKYMCDLDPRDKFKAFKKNILKDVAKKNVPKK